MPRIWAAFAGIAILVTCASVAQAPTGHRVEELAVLNGIGGFGDVGRIEASRDTVAPGNRTGFALRFTWKDTPADPPWWAIRQPLPPVDLRQVDGIAFDLCVEDEEASALRIYLCEPSDNRRVAFHAPLAGLPRGEWRHVEVRRDAMEQWRLSSRPFAWERVAALGIEPYGKRCAFLLDNVRLIGPGGFSDDVFAPTDDGPAVPLGAREPLQREVPRGTVFLPCDTGRMDDPELAAAPAELARLLGRVAVPLSGLGPNVVEVSRGLRARGVPTIAYSPMGDPFTRYLTLRGAWEENASGVSLNTTPGNLTGWDFRHTYAAAHPAVTEAQDLRFGALLRAGIGTWMVVDYTLPWMDTWWGYSAATRAAFRADLRGADEGLHLRDGTRMRFARYFRTHHGFDLTPHDLGLASWDAFEPPRPGETGPSARARIVVFHLLRAYEWLKLADRVGRRFVARGGQPLWIIPNPEDSMGSPDYVTMLRTRGVGNLFPEWFGCIGLQAEAAWASLPYLREVADRGGARLSAIHETGAGGHAAPYLDWRVAYSGIWALTAAGRLDDFDNDFLADAALPAHRKPDGDAYHFSRYRDTVVKALAFRQARAERPSRRPAPILCVAERPPARASGSIFFGLRQPHSLGLALARAHLPFDLRDSAGSADALDRYRVVVYSPMAPRAGDPERLRRWLLARPGRLLIAPAHVLTRDAREWWGFDRSAAPGKAAGGRALGLGEARTADRASDQVSAASAPWRGAFPPGAQVPCGSAVAGWSLGRAMVSGRRGALVTEARVGGSRVLTFHWTAEDPADPAALDASVRALRTAAATAGVRPVCQADADTSVQTFDVRGGQAVLVWDAPSLEGWRFEYRPGIPPLAYAAAGVDRTVRLAPRKRPLAYDFWRDRLETRDADLLRLRDVLVGLFYVGEDTPAFRRTVEAARAMRRKLRDLGFDRVP